MSAGRGPGHGTGNVLRLACDVPAGEANSVELGCEGQLLCTPSPGREEGPAHRLQFRLQQERLRSNPD